MDKKKKIRYLSIKQDKLEKKLIAEIEKYAPNRPKVPRETQNPYQYLTTFNNLIGYFREKPRPYGPLFTWAQSHQSFSKMGIPYQFENEYREGGRKVFTKEKVKKIEDERLNKNYNIKFFEEVDFTNMNNVFDLLDNPQLISRLGAKDNYSITNENSTLKSKRHKYSGDTQNNTFKSRKAQSSQKRKIMNEDLNQIPSTAKIAPGDIFQLNLNSAETQNTQQSMNPPHKKTIITEEGHLHQVFFFSSKNFFFKGFWRYYESFKRSYNKKITH